MIMVMIVMMAMINIIDAVEGPLHSAQFLQLNQRNITNKNI